MRRPTIAALASAAAIALTTLALAPSASADPPPSSHASDTGLAHRADKVCVDPGPDHVSCNAIRNDVVDANGKTVPTAATEPLPTSLRPDQIQQAYNLTGALSGHRTVAIVDAYHDPSAFDDFTTYRAAFHLPTCDTTDGCFQQVDQTGGTSYPSVDTGWAQEISLDLDMVSATCPDCRVLLVETKSSSFADLNAGVAYAAGQGVAAISNSYGGSDIPSTSYGAYAAAASQGIAVTASTGDSGYGAQSPATFPGVVAVGGTTLKPAAGTARKWSETAWNGAGSGCSRYSARPKYQTSVTKCSYKADADVSAVADPNTGVAVYDSTPDSSGNYGWMQFGGTSASSPIIASVYALAGHVSTTATAGSLPWAKAGTAALNDVISGSNGHCATKVLCTATGGWDGPTGLGTPWGTDAF